MKLTLVQYNPAWEGKQANKGKISSLLNKSCEESVIILPEMTLTGFTMDASGNAEELKGETFIYYSSMARDYKAHVLGGLIEKKDERFFNSLLHISPDGQLKSVYRKIHPFSYSSENKHYTAGEQVVTTKIEEWNIGLSICYDLRFPELYRMYAKQRTGLIVNIANWPDTRIEHWRTLLKARAIENQCYFAGVNRTGNDPKLKYIGYTSVFDPMGKEISSMSPDEGLVQAEINQGYVDEVRSKLPFLNDMVLI